MSPFGGVATANFDVYGWQFAVYVVSFISCWKKRTVLVFTDSWPRDQLLQKAYWQWIIYSENAPWAKTNKSMWKVEKHIPQTHF